jgi:DNA-binding NtrC family response regulator
MVHKLLLEPAVARILVVDDDDSTVKALDALFTMDRHEVVACTNARAALDALEHGAFDLVLADAQMPPARPGELVRLARRHQTEACLFVVSERRIDRGVEGACHVFEKPVSFDAITGALATCRAHGSEGASAGCQRRRTRTPAGRA